MRLLRIEEDGDFSLAEYIGRDIPQYAILSHTWGAEYEEVTLRDLVEGTGKSKAGYRKLTFCGKQATIDGLQYIWVDTCCIDKSSSAELSEAINSMFQWYQKAERCYVYLSDVSINHPAQSGIPSQQIFRGDFQDSRWFTRGWTLQELLAPTSVEFYSAEGERLGNMASLLQEIHSITNISIQALQGIPLSQFSVDERMSWIKGRETKREEDMAYSLLGIFDIHMPLIYGEGQKKALIRLREEIKKSVKSLSEEAASTQRGKEDLECIRNLRLTDPRDDKKRIEETKGGLLEGSYRWIFEHSGFQQWRDDRRSRLLWIKGDPGKGKTMLLCGIVDELKKSTADDLLSYFFCQATDSRINNANAVLRGLMYLLVDQQPSLISHIRKKHGHAGKELFEDANAWVTLSETLTNMLQDPTLNSTYLVIDALDEIATDLPKLLDFIVQKSSIYSRVKWIISSRNWLEIEERLGGTEHMVRVCLELNTESVSAAVRTLISQRVTELAQRKKYDDETRNAVQEHLVLNANGTFLWVALVCQFLSKIPRWNVLKKLNTFPPGLDSLYDRMMQQVSSSDHADICKQILASTATVYRPITVSELASLVEILEDMVDDLESIREVVNLCGSFLTLKKDTIYFVHQSAKDFIDKAFQSKKEAIHGTILARSLQVMSQILRRDIYSLGSLGYPIGRVRQPDPDPLAALRYSCVYWMDHFCNLHSKTCTIYKDAVEGFIRKKYIYWLEALSLCKNMPKGVSSMNRLAALVQVIH